jgi:hypothetical protein
MFGKLARKQQANCSLNLARRDGRLLIVMGKTGGFLGDAGEYVRHKGVHDGHGLSK